MRTLIIGDLHHQTWIADEICDLEPHEEVIFVGDYFDAHLDTPTAARETATWVRARLKQSRSKLLLGNHDLAYAFAAEQFPFVMCSGYQAEKAAAIAQVLDGRHWARLQAFAVVGPWLVSHAGFHRDLLGNELIRDPVALRQRCQAALEALNRREPDPIFAPGRERGGKAAVGGITWCDWKRFEGVEGVHQIVGHTPSKTEPLRHWSPAWSTNFCIDHGNGQTYAVVTDTCTTFRCLDSRGESLLLETIAHEPIWRSCARFSAWPHGASPS